MTSPPTKLKLALALGAMVMPLAPASGADPATIAQAVPKVSTGQVVIWPDLDGGAAGPMTVWVWLPPAYSKAGKDRFPVLYMHDGQNLFDRRLTNYDKAWDVDRTIMAMARRGDLRQWIVVGVQSPRHRYRTLFPAKLRALLSPAMRAAVDATDGDGGGGALPYTGDAYVRFLVETVKARVDRTYRTLAGSADTAVMGSSMGGLMALYAMAERPNIFGQAAAVSIHLPLADPSRLPADAVAQVTAAWSRYLSGSNMRPGANHLYMDHGTATLDQYYAPYFAAFDPMMKAAGWSGESYETRAFPGAEHDEVAWHARLDVPLAFLDRRDP